MERGIIVVGWGRVFVIDILLSVSQVRDAMTISPR
jgi:hypothetical protein